MSQKNRILIALAALVLLATIILGIDFLQRRAIANEMVPGSIPIYLKGRLVGSFLPTDLETLTQVSFVDDEGGKTQEGWMLREVLLLHITADTLHNKSVTVSSSSREKSHTLTWAEIDDANNMVMFDLSGRGTLKLVSKIPGFDTRDAWVQDVDRIDVE